jgi:predicted GNAT superfamily acetyltransferase
MSIQIRPLLTQDEYRAFQRLEQGVWPNTQPMRTDVLLMAQKNGGLVLGAFDVSPRESGERLIGILFGFIGLTPQGKVKHCSHMVGVHPQNQNQRVGYQLKMAQREHVLAQGIDLVTWTFDPLQSRNAYLNLRKLGAVCHTYLPNHYGEMQDGLNMGVSSDRFQVDWHITSQHVSDRLSGISTGDSLSALQAIGVPIVNPFSPDQLPAVRPTVYPSESDRLLIQVPADFQAIRSADITLACTWRDHTRALFETAFAAGYAAIDLLHEQGNSYYLLQRDWEPS